MVKRPYFRLGVGLILVGAVFIALNLWFLSAFHWDPPVKGRGNAGLIVIGTTLIVAGVMVLMGI
jgi:hypothetical protein